MKILTPAYGRDYTNSTDARQAYQNGADFILNDITNPYNGRLCSCRDFPNEEIKLRFASLRKFTLTTNNPTGDTNDTAN